MHDVGSPTCTHTWQFISHAARLTCILCGASIPAQARALIRLWHHDLRERTDAGKHDALKAAPVRARRR